MPGITYGAGDLSTSHAPTLEGSPAATSPRTHPVLQRGRFPTGKHREAAGNSFHSSRSCSVQPRARKHLPAMWICPCLWSGLEKAGREEEEEFFQHIPAAAASLSSSVRQRHPAGPTLPKHTVPSGKSIWPHPRCPCSCCQCLNRGHWESSHASRACPLGIPIGQSWKGQL